MVNYVDNYVRYSQDLTHLELLDRDGEGCRVQHYLTSVRQVTDKLLNDWLKLWRQQLVSLQREGDPVFK